MLELMKKIVYEFAYKQNVVFHKCFSILVYGSWKRIWVNVWWLAWIVCWKSEQFFYDWYILSFSAHWCNSSSSSSNKKACIYRQFYNTTIQVYLLQHVGLWIPICTMVLLQEILIHYPTVRCYYCYRTVASEGNMWPSSEINTRSDYHLLVSGWEVSRLHSHHRLVHVYEISLHSMEIRSS